MYLRKIITTLLVCLAVAIFVCGCSFGEGSGATSKPSTSDSISTPLQGSSNGQSNSEDNEEWGEGSSLPSESEGDMSSDEIEDSSNGTEENTSSTNSNNSSFGETDGTDDSESSSEDSGAESSDSSGTQTESSSSEQNPSESFEVWIYGSTICWSDVGANVYAVYIGEKQVAVTKTSYVPKNLSTGVYKVVVKAFLSDDGSISVESQTEYVVKAQKPQLTVNGSVISWDEVIGAKGYNIYKESAFIAQIQANSFTVEEDGIYSVSVVFEDERLNSEISSSVEVGSNVLSSPVLSRDGNYIEWTEVANAQTYLIYVNGKVAQMVTAGSDNKLNFMTIYILKFAQDYPEGVTVTVVARSSGFEDSTPSNEILFNV